MAVGDIFKLTTVCRQGDQIGLNVKYLEVTSETGSPEYDKVAANLEAELAPLYKALICTPAEWRGLALQQILPVSYVPVSSIANRGYGNVIGDPLPWQTAGLISFKTALTGRHNRGRLYIPFPGEASNSSGHEPIQAYQVAAQALGAKFVEGFSYTNSVPSWTITLRLIVYPGGINGPQRVQSMVVRQGWATQRRRGAFGAPNPVPIP